MRRPRGLSRYLYAHLAEARTCTPAETRARRAARAGWPARSRRYRVRPPPPYCCPYPCPYCTLPLLSLHFAIEAVSRAPPLPWRVSRPARSLRCLTLRVGGAGVRGAATRQAEGCAAEEQQRGASRDPKVASRDPKVASRDPKVTRPRGAHCGSRGCGALTGARARPPDAAAALVFLPRVSPPPSSTNWTRIDSHLLFYLRPQNNLNSMAVMMLGVDTALSDRRDASMAVPLLGRGPYVPQQPGSGGATLGSPVARSTMVRPPPPRTRGRGNSRSGGWGGALWFAPPAPRAARQRLVLPRRPRAHAPARSRGAPPLVDHGACPDGRSRAPTPARRSTS